MRIRGFRTVAVIGSAVLLVGAFAAAPADAKKKKKKKVVAACAPYAPAEKGKGAPVTTVTDAATAEAPVEVTLATHEGFGFSSEEGEGSDGEIASSHAYTNVLVDPASPSTGLTVEIEFNPAYDYDLHLRDGTGASVEYSAGSFNVSAGSDHAHSDVGIESLVGLPVADCQGFTVDAVGVGTPGGDITVRYWLQEAV